MIEHKLNKHNKILKRKQTQYNLNYNKTLALLSKKQQNTKRLLTECKK